MATIMCHMSVYVVATLYHNSHAAITIGGPRMLSINTIPIKYILPTEVHQVNIGPLS